MYRTAEFRRDVRERAIAHKRHILVNIWLEDETWEQIREQGRLDKMRIGCGCGLCKPGKRFGYQSEKDERRQKIAGDKMKDYLERDGRR